MNINFLLTVLVKGRLYADNDCVMRDGETPVPEFVARQRQITELKALHLSYEGDLPM